MGPVCRDDGPACNPLQESFVYSNGTLSLFGVPGNGVLGTYAYAISDSGVITGTYDDAGGFHGFRDDHGVFSTFELPPSTDYNLVAMNAEGQIGGYRFDGAIAEGFIATPTPVPEPAPFATCGAALVVLCGLAIFNAVDKCDIECYLEQPSGA